VRDAEGNALGSLMGFGPDRNSVILYRKGYFVTVEVSGEFPAAEISWTGNGCGGTPYLKASEGVVTEGKFASIYGKTVVFSGASGELMVPVSTGVQADAANGIFASEEIDRHSKEAANACAPTTTAKAKSGWVLTPFDASATLGWTLSEGGKGVVGPLQLPE
jgi:hypothetical protein